MEQREEAKQTKERKDESSKDETPKKRGKMSKDLIPKRKRTPAKRSVEESSESSSDEEQPKKKPAKVVKKGLEGEPRGRDGQGKGQLQLLRRKERRFRARFHQKLTLAKSTEAYYLEQHLHVERVFTQPMTKVEFSTSTENESTRREKFKW